MKMTKAHFACLVAFLAVTVINAFVALNAPEAPKNITAVTFASAAQ